MSRKNHPDYIKPGLHRIRSSYSIGSLLGIPTAEIDAIEYLSNNGIPKTVSELFLDPDRYTFNLVLDGFREYVRRGGAEGVGIKHG